MNYRFLKYFLALTIPFFAYLSFNGNGIITYAPVIEAFLIIPVLELFFKPNSKNLSDAEEEMSMDDRSYDIVLYLLVPIIYFLIWEFLGSMSENLSTSDTVGRILSMGLICGGLGINVAHELGHRNNKFEQLLAKMLLLPSLYMHFFIEHNRGHHKNVSTKEDPSSARYGENIFFFCAPVGITAESVLNKYIEAIGGIDNVASVNAISVLAEAEVQGMKLQMVSIQASPNKQVSMMMMMGNTMMKMVFDGEKGSVVQQGMESALPEEQVQKMVNQTLPFEEIGWLTDENVQFSSTEEEDGRILNML